MNAQLGQAIKAADVPEERVSLRVEVGPGGRFVVLNIPENLTPLELLALIGYLPAGVPKLLASRTPGPRILVPTPALRRA